MTSRQQTMNIRVADLRVSFGERDVLRSVSLEVEAGSIYGLLGQNGAGKTTTLHVLAGLLCPDAGDAWVAGHSMITSPLQAKRALGFVPDESMLFGALTAVEHLELVLDLRNDSADRTPRISEMLRIVGLAADAGRAVGQYSHGMRQRLLIAMALVGRPASLVMDEPTNGLDPGGLATLKQVLREVADKGHAVLLSSHQLDVVRDTCDRVGVLHGGRIVAEYGLPLHGTDLEQAFLAATAGAVGGW